VYLHRTARINSSVIIYIQGSQCSREVKLMNVLAAFVLPIQPDSVRYVISKVINMLAVFLM